MILKEKFSSREIEAFSEILVNSRSELCRDLSEIIIIEEGQGEIIVEGKTIPVHSGDVFLTTPLAYRRISTSEKLAYTSVSFSLDTICSTDDILREHIEFDGQGKLYRDDFTKNILLSAISGFNEAQKLPRGHNHEYALAVLRQTVIILSAASGESIALNDDELGAKICAYVNENLTEELSLERIAKAFFISKFYLCRAFKRYIGSSLHNYIVAKRIGLAKRLIDSGEVASAVAYKVGFGDYSAFYRAYMKHIGKAPTEESL